MPAIRETPEIERELELAEGARRALLAAELAWALRADDPARALRCAEGAEALLAELEPDDERVLKAALRMTLVRAFERRAEGDFEGCREWVRRAEGEPGLSLDPLARAMTSCLLASLDHGLGRQAAARRRLRAALEESPTSDADAQQGCAALWNELGRVSFALHEWSEAHGCFARSLKHAQRSGDRRLEGVVNVNLGNVHSQLRDFDGALSHYGRALELHRERRDPRGEGHALQNVAVVHERLDDLDEALRCARRALELVDDSSHEARSARLLLVHLLLVGEQVDEARPVLADCLDREREHGGPAFADALSLAARLADIDGDAEEARRLLERALKALDGVEDAGPAVNARLQLLRQERNAGRLERAQAIAQELRAAAGECGSDSVHAEVLEELERLAEDLGRPEEALAFLRERHALVLRTQREAARGRREILRTQHQLDRALSRERSLEEMREELELEVGRRTEELRRANEDLAAALNEKLRTERERELLADQLRQAQKMEAVGRLAGGIAHDFNNLLTVLRGHGEILASVLEKGSSEHESAQQIVESCDRAARLTSQLLAFSRHRPREEHPVDMNELVRGLEGMLRRLLGEQVELLIRPARKRAWVLADPGALEQVVLNLAINARDAMPGGGQLVLEVERAPADISIAGEARERIALRVSDTGAGIPPDTIDLIFEPFFTTKPPGEGTGLGLATSYGLVRQAGGTLRVDSTPGSGSTFEVLLPMVAAPAEPASLDASSRHEARSAPRRILLVEDEPALRHLLRSGLQALGHDVAAAGDGVEALELVEASECAFDVVVSDVVMPRLGGPELLRELRRRGLAPPVLLTSGWPDRAGNPPGRLGVEYGFLEKPFRLAELVDAVETLLSG